MSNEFVAMRVSSQGSPLYLDHASIVVPSLADAVAILEDRLGLRVTVSPAASDRHGRIHFDRSYLEVSAQEPTDEWGLGSFFLRFTDPESLRRHLEAAGIAHHFGVYEGVDGIWDDVEIRVGSVPLPILVRRTHPPEVAADWPPGLSQPHRCGAWTLEGVVVSARDLAATVEAYGHLLGIDAGAVAIESGRATLHLASGWITLEAREHPGLAGIVLGVASIADATRVVGRVDGAPVAWLDPGVTHGLRIGLTRVASDGNATPS